LLLICNMEQFVFLTMTLNDPLEVSSASFTLSQSSQSDLRAQLKYRLVILVHHLEEAGGFIDN